MRVKDWGSRKDANHREISKYFEQLACRVKDVSSIPGFVDIIVKRGSQVRFIEIKDPTKPKCDRKLTKSEAQFHDYWRDVSIVETQADVVRVVESML